MVPNTNGIFKYVLKVVFFQKEKKSNKNYDNLTTIKHFEI